jgi:MerR family transcriptional regulator/heat shock protein HspR
VAKKNDTKDNLDMDRKALYAICVAAELIGTTDQTLRLYEKHGLIKPARRGKNRYFSNNDIRWMKCIRDLIHVEKISIEGIKRLLDYAPCWEIRRCPTSVKEGCSAFKDPNKPCWELAKTSCSENGRKDCDSCLVYISHTRNKE